MPKPEKKHTLSELQSYIEGAIEFNDEEWFPNKKQWDKVVEMIRNIRATPAAVETVESVRPETVTTTSRELVSNVDNRNAGGAGASNRQLRPEEESVVLVPEEEYIPYDESNMNKLDMRTVKEEYVATMGEKDSDGIVSSGIRIKTPTIDTSTEEYKSSFD